MSSRIVTDEDIRTALLDTLVLWLPSYLREVCRQQDVDVAKVGLPKTFQGLPEQAALRADQLPALCGVIGKTEGTPFQDDDGKFVATWRAESSVVCRGDDQDTTRRNVAIYTAAMTAIIVQHGTLGGFATRSRWTGRESDTFDASKSGTIAAGFVDLLVTVPEVVDAYDGPSTPPVDPTEAWPPDPTADEITVLEQRLT